ncbi:hypothetical protein HII31_09123 [Pseudocercospora fuligena]|uniref:Uncharacterized protein n=1 Tax=Pseudocercospora fuligena TaxID=685502 RepID=A0A8H6RE87_9PEZI|nr:hypothetical protein HII31_09123 [Pseudocercospora fuligena]
MAASLRRILGKRALNTTPSPEHADQHRQTTSHIDAAQEPIKLGDLAVPAPPPRTLQRKSPSKEQLHKYKQKVPISKFATPSPGSEARDDSELVAASPYNTTETSPSLRSPRSAPLLASPTPTKRKVQAQGCEFDLMASGELPEASKSAEDLTAAGRILAALGPSRSTRSRSRKAQTQRSDSTHEDEIAISKDLASAAAFGTASKDTLQIPGLHLRKNSDDGTQSPPHLWTPKDNNLKYAAEIERDRKRSASEARTPSPRTRTSSKSPPTASKIPRHTPSPVNANPALYSPLIDFCKNNNNNNPSTTSDSPNIVQYETVRVRPPIYDLSKPPGQQWEQFGITSSRPERAWEPAPRWTCCTCGSQTIVEQIVCSNLECGHDRCHNRCQVRPPSRRDMMFGRM